MKKLAVFSILLLLCSFVFAGGSMEESSTGSVQYEASRGNISRPEQIVTSSIIAAVDYNYPEPEGDFGINLYSGTRQVAQDGGSQVFVLGIQGARKEMAELPPMNLCFVIDHSGSMSGQDKMAWVHDSFEIFIETVRDTDYVSVVKFDDDAEVVFPSTRMSGKKIREQLRAAVRSIRPEGGTNLSAGLETGYQQVMTNFREEYTNRVLFLTDGQGNSEGMLEMAETFAEMNINVSTIGLGSGFNGELLRAVAKAGGGTSRFISDRETMQEVFGAGLSRMVVPVLRDLELFVKLPEGAAVTGTWAYESRIEGNRIAYIYPAVHVGDYETIVLQAELPAFRGLGSIKGLEVTGTYTDSAGEERRVPSLSLELFVVENGTVPDGFSDAVVLRAGTMLHYAATLKQIGEIYYSASGGPEGTGESTAAAGGAPGAEEKAAIERALGLANALKKELYFAEERLEYEGFAEEIEVVENYIRILGGYIQYEEEKIEEVVADREPHKKETRHPFPDRVEGLFTELSLSVKKYPKGALVVSGFSFKDDREAPILEFLTNFAETSLISALDFPIVSRRELGKVLEEQKLSLSGLFETEQAIEVGKLLAARYMITGTVVEMGSSVIIFSRIIDVESGQILGAAQIIVEKDDDVRSLLNSV